MINSLKESRTFNLRHLLVFGGAFLFVHSTCNTISYANQSSVQNESIRDIMVSRPPVSIWPFIIGGLVVALLLVGVWFASRLAKTPKLSEKGPPADYVALEKLDKISKNIDSISPNEASLEVSNTVKDYLSGRFRDPIRYETAEEFFGRISAESSSSNLSEGLVDQVRSFLRTSQELKFAKLREGHSQIPVLINQAEKIVKAAKKESKIVSKK